MSIIAVGCNHSSASLAVLESLAIPSSETPAVLRRLQSLTGETLVLSTCNRVEIYATAGHVASGAELLLQFFAERAGMPASVLRAHLYVHAGADAAIHALRVASGLDSMVLGEDQIQAQWKRALAHAREARTLGPVLHRLGAAALSCGKRVRTFTGIGKHSVSLESLAVRTAAARLGTLDGREVLLIGTGESAALVARHLRAAHDARITVTSRSLEKAHEFANHIGATAVSMDAVPQVLTRADGVFCCTSAPHAVLAAEHLARRVAERPGEPLVCVDLGMPRDIEASVAAVPDTHVVSIHELSELADHHRDRRREHLPAAEAIVHTEAARFLEWRSARGKVASHEQVAAS